MKHLPQVTGFDLAVKPISWSDFEKVDIRVGVVVDAREFPEAKRSAYRSG